MSLGAELRAIAVASRLEDGRPPLPEDFGPVAPTKTRFTVTSQFLFSRATMHQGPTIARIRFLRSTRAAQTVIDEMNSRHDERFVVDRAYMEFNHREAPRGLLSGAFLPPRTRFFMKWYVEAFDERQNAAAVVHNFMQVLTSTYPDIINIQEDVSRRQFGDTPRRRNNYFRRYTRDHLSNRNMRFIYNATPSEETRHVMFRNQRRRGQHVRTEVRNMIRDFLG